MKHEILYAIVQFRPYRETEEFANVGVVMCAPKTGFFDYRIETKTFSRVRGFFNELDRQLPKRVTGYIASELERVKTMTQCGYQPDRLSALFHEVTKIKEGLIYYSNVRPAIIEGELTDILDKLYQHHVHHSFAKQPSATEQLEVAMRMQLFYAESLEIELPEGWVLVPKQATPTMIAVGQHADDNAPALCDEQVARVWKGMVTIAPTLDQDGWKI